MINVGDRFSSYEDLERTVALFEKESNTTFWKREAKTIQSVSKKNASLAMARKELKYYIVKYSCVAGGRKYSKRCTTDTRTSRTLRQDCRVFILVLLSSDRQYLEIKSMNMEHNHPTSEALFRSMPKVRRLDKTQQKKVRTLMNLQETSRKLPQQRRLQPDVKQFAMEIIDLDVNKKRMLRKLRTETGKSVTLKDLYNLAKQDRLNYPVEEITLQEEIHGHNDSEETNANEPEPVSACHNYDADTNANEPVPADTENDDKMVFIQNRANKAVEELVSEKKRSNELKEKLLEESRKRNKYLEALLKLGCLHYNQSFEDPMQE